MICVLVLMSVSGCGDCCGVRDGVIVAIVVLLLLVMEVML